MQKESHKNLRHCGGYKNAGAFLSGFSIIRSFKYPTSATNRRAKRPAGFQIVDKVRLTLSTSISRPYRIGLTPSLVGARARNARLRVFLRRQSCRKNGFDNLRPASTKQKTLCLHAETDGSYGPSVCCIYPVFCSDAGRAITDSYPWRRVSSQSCRQTRTWPQ